MIYRAHFEFSPSLQTSWFSSSRRSLFGSPGYSDTKLDIHHTLTSRLGEAQNSLSGTQRPSIPPKILRSQIRPATIYRFTHNGTRNLTPAVASGISTRRRHQAQHREAPSHTKTPHPSRCCEEIRGWNSDRKARQYNLRGAVQCSLARWILYQHHCRNPTAAAVGDP